MPKKYYWQEPRNDKLPTRTKAWHASIRALQGMVHAGESAGEVIANMTGLSHSEYSREYYTPNSTSLGPNRDLDATRTAMTQSQSNDSISDSGEDDNNNSASHQI
jgi:hypothetical protein